MYVVPHNTLTDSFRIQIVCFPPKQDSDRKVLETMDIRQFMKRKAFLIAEVQKTFQTND